MPIEADMRWVGIWRASYEILNGARWKTRCGRMLGNLIRKVDTNIPPER